MDGTVNRIHDRGYGFIKPDGHREDAFFHCSQLQGLVFGPELVGQRVEFDIVTDERSGKERAGFVRPLES